MNLSETVRHWAAGHQATAWSIGGGLLLAAAVAAVWLTRSARRAGRDKMISAMISFAALMATAVQASGMWKFFGNTMGLPVGFRIFMFSFMEIALLACGLRARANVDKGGDAGIDGVLVWVLALASGLMSSSDAATVREGLMRVLVSVVVALLWTRDLMAAKQAARATSGKPPETVRWRLSIKELAVKIGLASPVDSSLASLDANRRAEKYLRASDRRRALEQAKPGSAAYARAVVAEARAQGKLMRHARLHADPTELMARLGQASMGDAMERLGVTPADASVGPDVRESVSPRVRESVGPDVRESASAGVRESASVGPRVRESASEGVRGSADGLASVGPWVRESVDGRASGSVLGLASAGPDPVGPWVRGSASAGADRGPDMAAEAGFAGGALAGSQAAGLIPGMRHTPDAAAFTAAQTANGSVVRSWDAAGGNTAPEPWFPGSAPAGLTESEGPAVPDSQRPRVRESASANGSASVDGRASESVSPRVRESESVSPRVRESASAGVRESESVSPRVRESASAGVRESEGSEVREYVSLAPQGAWSLGVVESDPRWSDETGVLARQIIARHFVLDSGRPTRKVFLELLREGGGTVANAHRTALYAWAMAPNVPTEAELGDDTADFPNGIPGLSERLERDELARSGNEG